MVGKVVPAALVALFVVLVGVNVPRTRPRTSVIAAIAVGLLALVGMYLAWIALKSPWLMGVLMAIIMALGVLVIPMGRSIALLANLFGTIFFFYSAIGLDKGLDATDVLVQGLLGAAAGVAVLITVWVVMQPAPDATRARGLQRIVGVMAGCLIIAGLAFYLTPDIIVILGLCALFIGILYYLRNWAVYVAGISILTVALHGEFKHYSFEAYAGWRVLDTVIGITIGFALYFLVVTLPDRRRGRTAT